MYKKVADSEIETTAVSSHTYLIYMTPSVLQTILRDNCKIGEKEKIRLQNWIIAFWKKDIDGKQQILPKMIQQKDKIRSRVLHNKPKDRCLKSLVQLLSLWSHSKVRVNYWTFILFCETGLSEREGQWF